MSANPIEASELLKQLSSGLSALVERAAVHLVRVEGRRRLPSSGVVWSGDGVIVTAHHTLDRDEATVGLPSGETVEAEVVGRDPSTDLAALRVSGAGARGLAGPSGLAPAAWGDEGAVSAGQLALGVSRPGRSPRAALGIVARAAGEFRARRGGRIDRFLETTLDLHPGVSGSLVLGVDGAALGLATAGLVRGAVMVVPPSTLRRVVKSLLAHGEVRRGYLGIATHPVPLPPELRERTGEELALLVSHVDPAGPAARAGLALGDAILSVGGEALQDPGELFAVLSEERIGEAVTLRLLRAGQVLDVQVTVGVRERRQP